MFLLVGVCIPTSKIYFKITYITDMTIFKTFITFFFKVILSALFLDRFQVQIGGLFLALWLWMNVLLCWMWKIVVSWQVKDLFSQVQFIKTIQQFVSLKLTKLNIINVLSTYIKQTSRQEATYNTTMYIWNIQKIPCTKHSLENSTL